jgi:transcriptional regulator with XRE-family HTH domain
MDSSLVVHLGILNAQPDFTPFIGRAIIRLFKYLYGLPPAAKREYAMANQRKVSNQLLLQARLESGWTQEDLADRIDTDPQNISRWEIGQSSPRKFAQQRLCTLFGKTPQELGFIKEATIQSHPIRRAREEKGWTQEDLAKRIQLRGDLSPISRWEREIATPSAFYRRQLCALFEKAPQELGFVEETASPLQQAREEKGWSQQYVADQIGTYPVNVSRWERGKARPNPALLERLRLLFGVDPQEPEEKDHGTNMAPTRLF